MLFVSALLLAVQTAPAPAQPAAAAVPAPAQEKKTCRRDESLGTIIAKRVCHTQAEWAAIDQQNARNAERFGNDRDNSRGMRPGE